MPHYPKDYMPVKHGFIHIADVLWPATHDPQLDWVSGLISLEDWLVAYTGPKYSRWAWNTAKDAYYLSVAFKYDKHRTLFLLRWA